MKLIQTKKADINYLAKVIYLDDNSFSKHPNADALKIAHVGGYNIIVGIDEKPGVYIYFPALSKINENLLSYANLYRHVERNLNPDVKPGFFEDTGRVKAIKLRGVVSDGFLLPAKTLRDFLISYVNVPIDQLPADMQFDAVEHQNKEIWICKKYKIIQSNGNGNRGYSKSANKPLKGISKLVEGQFKRHYDTVKIQNDPYCIDPKDVISITSKWDGTSAISGYVLCQQELNWKQKLAKWLTKEPFYKYGYLFSSRNIIQNEDTADSGYYGAGDYSSRLAAHKVIEPFLMAGMTIYYEIVGYLNTGAPWMKRKGEVMDYGCVPPDTTVPSPDGKTRVPEYIEGKHYKIYIYRITLTNVNGQSYEFSPREVQIWCKNNGLRCCEEFYYGRAVDLYPDLCQIVNGDDENPLVSKDWSLQFLDRLANDENFYMECDSPDCNNKVPHEGIVIKKDDMIPRAWKLKTFAHTNAEQQSLDSGESNIEDES